VNCPAIPFELAESELFGYEKGAFSGARSEGKSGKFELGEGGTIFLDEISSLSVSIQPKLLRVLQEKEIERLGGKDTVKVDFRLVAATNASLTNFLAEGRFRSDLFYRISNVPIEIPPLRERKDDIILYIDHFFKQINKRLKTEVKGISDEALQIMMHYSWPGNLRELINILEQSILRVVKGHITPEYLPSFLFERDCHISENSHSLKSILEEIEEQTIKRTLNFTKGNKRKAAALLGIQRSVLYQKLKKYHE
jgi:transcriptional regulator with PAS, ATPase and Fis domain